MLRFQSSPVLMDGRNASASESESNTACRFQSSPVLMDGRNTA